MDSDSGIGQVREILGPLSKLTFGKQLRLEVIYAASEVAEPIWSRQLGTQLLLPDNQVSVELVFLAKLGALVQFPADHDRRKLYQRAPHPIWPFATRLAADSIREAAGEGLVKRYFDEIREGAQRAIPERPG